MIFLYSTISSSKSIFGMVAIIRQASALIVPAGHMYRFLDASGLAGCSFPLYCASPRNSFCFVRGPLVCFACRGLCSSAGWWLCSSRFFSSSLQIFLFFSLSSYPCCFTSCFFLTTGSLAVVPSVFLSHHWLFVCGSACASFSESLCGKLRLRGSFRTTAR